MTHAMSLLRYFIESIVTLDMYEVLVLKNGVF